MAARDGRPFRVGGDTATTLTGAWLGSINGYIMGPQVNYILDNLSARTYWASVTSTVPSSLAVLRRRGVLAPIEISRTPGATCNPLLEFTIAEPGRYVLAVTGAYAGDYRMRVDTVRPTPAAASCPVAQSWAPETPGVNRWLPTLTKGYVVEGSLGRDRASDDYLLIVDTTQRVRLGLVANAPFGELVIRSTDGRERPELRLAGPGQDGGRPAPICLQTDIENRCAELHRVYEAQLPPGRFVVTVRNGGPGYRLGTQ